MIKAKGVNGFLIAGNWVSLEVKNIGQGLATLRSGRKTIRSHFRPIEESECSSNKTSPLLAYISMDA